MNSIFLEEMKKFCHCPGWGHDFILCVTQQVLYLLVVRHSSLKKNPSPTVSRGIHALSLVKFDQLPDSWFLSACLVSKRSWTFKSELKNHIVLAHQVKSNSQVQHDSPAQWNITCPERINTGNGISHLALVSQVEISVMGKFEGQQISGVTLQNLLP